MNDLAAAFDSRTLEYLGQSQLDPWGVTIVARGDQVREPEIQLALLTAAALFARMTPHVRIDVDDAPLVPHLHPLGRTLLGAIRAQQLRARPEFLHEPVDEALVTAGPVVSFDGHSPATLYTAGYGWIGSVDTAPIASPPRGNANPFGPCMAAILAASEVFQLAVLAGHQIRRARINTWTWTSTDVDGPDNVAGVELGRLWIVGAGSVGSSALHFLALATRRWSVRLTDKDVVKIENYSRTPVFGVEDGDGVTPKVESCARYLRAFGIEVEGASVSSLHEDTAWRNRPRGYPDALIPTANEENIHAVVEGLLPPLQVHATTGQNWQIMLMRHVPGRDPCSLCSQPSTSVDAALACSTAPVQTRSGTTDAALPFLSFGAGLAIAAEIVKIAMTGEATSPNRTFVQFRGNPIVRAPMTPSESCICRDRPLSLLLRVAGRYRGLSEHT